MLSINPQLATQINTYADLTNTTINSIILSIVKESLDTSKKMMELNIQKQDEKILYEILETNKLILEELKRISL